MLTLWLTAGLLGAQPVAVPQSRGGSTYISVKRQKRKEEHEERAEIRAIIERAFEDPTPEAVEVIAAVKPFVAQGETLRFDWRGIERELDRIRDALDDYAMALEARARADAEDDDDITILLAA
jgi:uncharacterized protein YpuA (DUF1002 family)